MGSVREKLTNMFAKVMAGTVTREEGTMLINHLVKEDQVETVKELTYLIDNPPPGVFPKTILHTISLSRNKAFHNILVASLEHKSEDVSIMAAQELARLKTSDAKKVLAEHLNSEVYHVRKASSMAIVNGFVEGVEVLKAHMLQRNEAYYRSTDAFALAKAGRKGIETLIEILNSGDPGAVASAAEVLISAADDLSEADIPKIFEALMVAGDRKDGQLITELLKIAASLKGRAKGFEGFVLAFADYPADPVRNEAQKALTKIRSTSAK